MMKRACLLIALGGIGLLAAFHVERRTMPSFHAESAGKPRGAYHIHTRESHDSSVRLEDVVSTARKLQLDFIVVTDHNSQLLAPLTADGLTVLSYAELTTPSGHIVQLGAGSLMRSDEREPRGAKVMQLVREKGGVPIIAHPSHDVIPWEGSLDGAAGIEIANLSSSVRRRGGPTYLRLLPAALMLAHRPEHAMSQAYDRDHAALQRWDSEGDPHLVGLCTGDSHGRVDLLCNMATWELVLDEELPRDEKQRPAAILEALTSGRFHCSAGLLGRPRFSFFGRTHSGDPIYTGDTVRSDEISELVVRGPRMRGDSLATLALLRDGREIMVGVGEELRHLSPGPGTYRVEARVELPGILFGGRLVPVLYSNRIRVQDPD